MITARLVGGVSILLFFACAGAPDDSELGSNAVTSRCPEGTIDRDGGCDPMLSLSCELPESPAPDAINLSSDRVYTTAYEGTSYAAPQSLDVAWPRGGAGHTIALLVHGGGFSGGDKSDHREDIRRLARIGYVAISINYRLVEERWKNRFPAAISDVRCAVRWAKEHAGELGGDASRVIAIGASAGGNLVELLATSSSDSRLDDGQCAIRQGDPSVAGAVAYYGRADLSWSPIPSYVVDYVGRDSDWTTREAAASPLRQVSASSAPLLMIHGQSDDVVPVAHSRAMRTALRSFGVPVGIMELPEQGHAFPLLGARGAELWGACSTLAFLTHFTR